MKITVIKSKEYTVEEEIEMAEAAKTDAENRIYEIEEEISTLEVTLVELEEESEEYEEVEAQIRDLEHVRKLWELGKHPR